MLQIIRMSTSVFAHWCKKQNVDQNTIESKDYCLLLLDRHSTTWPAMMTNACLTIDAQLTSAKAQTLIDWLCQVIMSNKALIIQCENGIQKSAAVEAFYWTCMQQISLQQWQKLSVCKVFDMHTYTELKNAWTSVSANIAGSGSDSIR